jgi:hypothetical protein
LEFSPDEHVPELRGGAHAKFHGLEKLFLVKSDKYALEDDAGVENVEIARRA